ncbi:MAG: hypothetical protein WB561_19565 [Terracidiphilus sp.]
MHPHRDDRSLLAVAMGDGRFLIALTGIALALSGGFAILQSLASCFHRTAMRSGWIRRH